MTSAFNRLTCGLDEVESYLSGDGEGFQVHVPDAVDGAPPQEGSATPSSAPENQKSRVQLASDKRS